MLQVSFHPPIVGTYFVQLCTFRNIKKTIVSKRETEWYPRSFTEDGQDFFTCYTHNRQKCSRHSSEPRRGLHLFLSIFFFKSIIWSSVLYTGRGDRAQEEELLQRFSPPEPSISPALRGNRSVMFRLNVQNMKPGKCRIRCCSWHQLPASQEVPAWASYHLGLHQVGRVKHLCYSSDTRTRRALLPPLTLCRVQGGCTSEVHSPSSRWCKQTVLGLMCPADRTARCATSLMGYPTRGARQD